MNPKKNRIIFFSKTLLDCIGFFVDFDPRLREFIKIDDTKTQKAIFEFKIPANGKFHKFELPPPDF